jgi:hypothetical protein
MPQTGNRSAYLTTTGSTVPATGAGVFTEREERSAVAIASNQLSSGWTKTFTDPRLSAPL